MNAVAPKQADLALARTDVGDRGPGPNLVRGFSKLIRMFNRTR